MNTLITYLVATVVSLGIFYSVFMLLLRREPLFRFNRFYLLTGLLLSYLIPLIVFLPGSFAPALAKAVNDGIFGSTTLSPVEISATASNYPSVLNLVKYLYIAGMLFFTFRLVARITNIYRIGKRSERSDEQDARIRWSLEDIPPFSFFGNIYLPLNLKGKLQLHQIIRHEQIHIEAHHSLDIAFTQLMQILFWVNPFIPLVEKSLREIHEFEADKEVISADTDPVAYTKILFWQDKTAQAIVLGNNFNYSLIKRRLTMFYKKSTRFARLKAVLVLPLAICTVMIYSISCNQSSSKATSAEQTDSALIPPPPPPPPPPAAGDEQIYTVVEVMPQYPGGDEARVKYMMNTIKYPKDAKEKGLQGVVYVSFVVEKDGQIGEAKVLKGIGTSCDEEALRVVKAMPKWTPGTNQGMAVRVQFTMPIKFKLEK